MKGSTVMRGLVGAIALSVAAGSSPACGGDAPVPAVTAGEAVAVTVAPVVIRDSAERLEAGGVVAASESASISSRIVATIASIRVKAGDRVRAGDLLVTLDAGDITEQAGQTRAAAVAADKALTRARTEQAVAEADHRLASAWQKRMAALHARSSATDQERDEAEARYSAAAARLAGAEAGIEAAEAQLAAARAAIGVAAATESYTALRAPFDGMITERLSDPGNLAAPGVVLLRIESDGTRQVVVRIDEARAGYIRPGARVQVLLDGPGQSVEDGGVGGTVAEVARAIGADQRAFTVKVNVPAAVKARSGTFARVVFAGASRRALFVPPQSVQRHGQVTSVYVVEAGVARLRLIHPGASSPDGVEVLAGLEPGESVVTSPLTQLTDGARVLTNVPPGSTTGGLP